MASSGAAEKPKFHDGKLKPYPHEELGREVRNTIILFLWHTHPSRLILLLCVMVSHPYIFLLFLLYTLLL
jgi:hypothetical protein